MLNSEKENLSKIVKKKNQASQYFCHTHSMSKSGKYRKGDNIVTSSGRKATIKGTARVKNYANGNKVYEVEFKDNNGNKWRDGCCIGNKYYIKYSEIRCKQYVAHFQVDPLHAIHLSNMALMTDGSSDGNKDPIEHIMVSNGSNSHFVKKINTGSRIQTRWTSGPGASPQYRPCFYCDGVSTSRNVMKHFTSSRTY